MKLPRYAKKMSSCSKKTKESTKRIKKLSYNSAFINRRMKGHAESLSNCLKFISSKHKNWKKVSTKNVIHF